MFLKSIASLVVTTVGLTTFVNSVSATPILIDSFDTEQDVGLLSIPSIIPASSQVGSDSSILGGFRDLQAMGDADDFLETRIQVASGNLNFSNDVGTNGLGMIVWDGDDDPTVVNPSGLGGIDITQNGGSLLEGILVGFIASDRPGLELGFTIWDLEGNTSSLSHPFNSAITTPQDEIFPLTDFVGNADFTNVGAIKLQIDGPPEIETAIDLIEIAESQTEIESVPEPATSLPILLGISGLAGLLKKRVNSHSREVQN